MKKLFLILAILLLFYFALQSLLTIFSSGHVIEYSINEFEIKEEYINKKAELQTYNFKISNKGIDFYLQIFENFDSQKKIISDIKSYISDEITCILPIFINDKILTDLICVKDDVFYNYAALVNSNSKIDEFYQSFNNILPKENLEDQDAKDNVLLYKDNLQKGYNLSLITYKGFIFANSIDKKLISKSIYKNDVYDHYLSAYLNEFYVTVNYDEQYGYSKIYIYNILNGDKNEIIISKNIEKNSYIEGIYDNSLYIFDRSNKKQYEINTLKMSVKEVGNVSKGVKIYHNGVFERVSAYDCANKDILFNYVSSSDSDYVKIGATLGKKTGYTYYYKKDGDEYRIYRVNNFYPNVYTYLFKTRNIDKLIFINEYIFFIDNNYIKYYSDHTGIRSLAYNSELSFNQNIKYQIIYQK